MSSMQPLISEKISTPVPQYGNLPLIGMLPHFLGDHPLHVLYEAMMREGGLIQLNLGVTSAYLVSSPEAFQHILRDNHHNYPKPRMFYGALKKLIGNGLVTSEGDFWLRQRRMIQPYMHRKYLSGLTDIMVAGIDEALDSWEGYVERGEELDFGKQMSRVTINVVTKSMFGQDISVARMDLVSQVVPPLLDYLNTRGFLSFIPEWIPLPGDQKFTENYVVLRQQLTQLIDERRQDASGATDLITMLINAVDNETNEQMTDDQLFDEALTIFAAGFETTSTTLAWLWYILSQHHTRQPDTDDGRYSQSSLYSNGHFRDVTFVSSCTPAATSCNQNRFHQGVSDSR
jgi:cytochrome P450